MNSAYTKILTRSVGEILGELIGISNDEKNSYSSVYISEPNDKFKFLTDIIVPDEWMKLIRHGYPETNDHNLPHSVRWFVQMYEKSREAAAPNQ